MSTCDSNKRINKRGKAGRGSIHLPRQWIDNESAINRWSEPMTLTKERGYPTSATITNTDTLPELDKRRHFPMIYPKNCTNTAGKNRRGYCVYIVSVAMTLARLWPGCIQGRYSQTAVIAISMSAITINSDYWWYVWHQAGPSECKLYVYRCALCWWSALQFLLVRHR